MGASVRAAIGGTLVVWLGASASAQESKSAALAKQLTEALEAAKITAVAAKDPSQSEGYVAAMYLPGTLLVVSARFSVPAVLDAKIATKDYQDAYVDLQSASTADSRVFVQDLNADGLRFKTFDSIDTAKGSTSFDGDWKKAKAASELENQKSFADSDERYVKMLQTLITSLKKSF